MAAVGPQKMNWWYHSIIEWMIQNPEHTLGECARALGVTQSWLSCIIHSHAFQEAYHERRGEHFSNTSHTVVRKMEGIALQTSELISQRLDEEGDRLPLAALQSTAELALKTLGYVQSHGRPPSVNVQVNSQVGVSVSVDRSALARSRERMRLLSAPGGPSSHPQSQEAPALTSTSPVPSAPTLALEPTIQPAVTPAPRIIPPVVRVPQSPARRAEEDDYELAKERLSATA